MSALIKNSETNHNILILNCKYSIVLLEFLIENLTQTSRCWIRTITKQNGVGVKVSSFYWILQKRICQCAFKLISETRINEINDIF